MQDEFEEFFQDGGKPSVIQILNKTEDAPLLQGTRPPPIYLKSERPAHRLVANAMAQGFTQKEIAESIGVNPVTVSIIARQPHVQQTLANNIRDRMQEDKKVVEVIKQNVVLAVETLADIMQDEKAKNSDRIAAAESLLNRRYGKPNQPINRDGEIDLNSLSDSELAAQMTQSTVTSREA